MIKICNLVKFKIWEKIAKINVRGSCLATSNEKPECEKNSGFFMPV